MAATHEYSCVISLHVLIDYRNISIINFARGQKVVPAGWLVSADGLEISLHDGQIKYLVPKNCVAVNHTMHNTSQHLKIFEGQTYL